MTKITGEDLISLVDLFDRSDWMVLHLETDEHEIYFSKDPDRRRGFGGSVSETTRVPGSGEDREVVAPSPKPKPSEGPSSVRPDTPVEEGTHIVRAPSLGTFYRAPNCRSLRAGW